MLRDKDDGDSVDSDGVSIGDEWGEGEMGLGMGTDCEYWTGDRVRGGKRNVKTVGVG